MVWFWGAVLFLVFYGSILFGDRPLKSKIVLSIVVTVALVILGSLQLETDYFGCHEYTQQGNC
jgi:hypothetical protein